MDRDLRFVAHARLSEAVLHTRCRVLQLQFRFAAWLVHHSIESLPEDHPGRAYARGRFGEGRKRIGEATSREATARYLSHRRHRRR